VAKRTTKVSVNIESVPEHKATTSKVAVNFEERPQRFAVTSKVAIMFEYILSPDSVYGPAAQTM